MKHKPFAEQLACFTGEFVGGIIAGIGLGIIIANSHLATSSQHVVVGPFLWICAFLCASGGGLLARSARLKRRSKNDNDDKHDA
jgi:hypothetical protein